jgi:hypothetical protein
MFWQARAMAGFEGRRHQRRSDPFHTGQSTDEHLRHCIQAAPPWKSRLRGRRRRQTSGVRGRCEDVTSRRVLARLRRCMGLACVARNATITRCGVAHVTACYASARVPSRQYGGAPITLNEPIYIECGDRRSAACSARLDSRRICESTHHDPASSCFITILGPCGKSSAYLF